MTFNSTNEHLAQGLTRKKRKKWPWKWQCLVLHTRRRRSGCVKVSESTSRLLYFSELHAALKKKVMFFFFSTTQAIRHCFKMYRLLYTNNSINSIPMYAAKAISYFMFCTSFRSGFFRTIWFSTISIEDTIWIYLLYTSTWTRDDYVKHSEQN